MRRGILMVAVALETPSKMRRDYGIVDPLFRARVLIEAFGHQCLATFAGASTPPTSNEGSR